MNDMTEASDRLYLRGERYLRRGRHVAAKRQTTVNFPLHFHSYFELEIVLCGRGRQQLNGESYDIAPGDVYLLTPTDYHGVAAYTEQITLWNIIFDEQALTEEACRRLMTEGLLPRALSAAQLDRADRLCTLLSEECEEDEACCDTALLETLLSLLFRAFPDIGARRAGEHDGVIAKACRYLETHFRDAPTLSEIAAHVGFHPAYFSEQFKRAVGMSYTERLCELRIAYSKQLLLQGMRVSEACFGSGFGSLSNFQHCFKQHVGISPREFKTLNKQ